MQLITGNRRAIAEATEVEPSKTLAEAIYRQLRQNILSGELKPGSKLRFSDLKVDYRASNSTLRESLSRLTADCLVTAVGQRGFRVASVSLTELWDITKMRCDVEASALSESIDSGDDVWEANIIAALHRFQKFEKRLGDIPAYLTSEGAALHKQLHMTLLAGCSSTWRQRVIDLLYDHSERYRRLLTSNLPTKRDSPREHREIVDATIGRQKELAVALLRLHIEKTAEILAGIKGLWGTTDQS